jgi:hypothetical protein
MLRAVRAAVLVRELRPLAFHDHRILLEMTVTLSISSIYLRNRRGSAGVITFDATVGEEYGARPWHAQHALAVRIWLGVFPVQRLNACVNPLTS